MDELVKFIRARLAEEEPAKVCGCLDTNHWPPCSPQPWKDRKWRELAAIRSHLRAWEAVALNFTRVSETEREFGAREALEHVLEADATIWSDHPDYRQEWSA